jgi:hypothetical protein
MPLPDEGGPSLTCNESSFICVPKKKEIAPAKKFLARWYASSLLKLLFKTKQFLEVEIKKWCGTASWICWSLSSAMEFLYEKLKLELKVKCLLIAV